MTGPEVQEDVARTLHFFANRLLDGDEDSRTLGLGFQSIARLLESGVRLTSEELNALLLMTERAFPKD